MQDQLSQRGIVEARRAPGAGEPQVEAQANELGVKPANGGCVGGQQWYAVPSDRRENGIRLRAGRVDGKAVDRQQDRIDRGAVPAPDVPRHQPTGPATQVFEAIAGSLEQGLEHQVHQQVIAAYVDHERHGRPDGGDVRKTLVGSDADEGAACDVSRPEVADGVQVRGLVRDEVIRIEVARGLRQPCDGARERGVVADGDDLDPTGSHAAREPRTRHGEQAKRREERADRA